MHRQNKIAPIFKVDPTGLNRKRAKSLDSPMFKSSSHFGSEFKDGEVEILNPTNQIVQTDICSS